MVVYPLFQAEEGGSIPTSALQLLVTEMPREVFQDLNRKWHSRLPRCGNCFMGMCYGAQFDGVFYAVAWWSHPVNPQLTDGKTWELRRMAVGPQAPRNTASRFLAIMVRVLRKIRPELTRLVSYQDTEVHTGAIYKASGWNPAYVSKFSTWTRDSGVGTKKRLRNQDQSKADKIRWELLLK